MQRIAALLVAVFFVGCGDDSSDAGLMGAPLPGSISLSTEVIDFTAIGASLPLHATLVDERGDPIADAKFSWSSSEEQVATVSDTGVVTATGKGRAEIAVAYGAITAAAHVRVSPTPLGIAALRIVPEDPTLTAIGQTLELRAVALNAAGETISEVLADWQTSTPTVATVDRGGVLEAVANGETQIAATLLDGSLSTETLALVRQAPAELRFLQQPSDTMAGVPMDGTPMVELVDAGGERIQGAVEVRVDLLVGEEGSLASDSAVQVTSTEGLAAFSDLALEQAGGPFFLEAHAEKASATSEPFYVAPALPTQLVFVDLPLQVATHSPIAIQVAVADPYGNLTEGPEGEVQLQPLTHDEAPLPALIGSLIEPLVGGVASFELEATAPGAFRLQATTDLELLPAEGEAIEVVDSL